ncbi:MAG: aminopeptidase, partial [Clostridia bacterium]|nr:aminopeptidase [Clostridia bacterium]
MDKRLKEYARLAVRQGNNLQKGQTLLLRAPVECAEFARLIAEEAYAAGAGEVITDWSDDAMTRLKYLHAEDKVFDTVRPWIKERYDTLADEDFALMTVYAEDPEALKGVDPDRIRRASAASGNALKDYYDKMMRSDFSWCVVSVPVLSWAKKVFPEKSDKEAMGALWDAIYETLRIDGSGSAVEKWAEHTARLHENAEKLNALELVSLHYENSLGTDFTVGLPEGYRFLGGAEKNRKGNEFIANMPTEEIFTAPAKYSGNGV